MPDSSTLSTKPPTSRQLLDRIRSMAGRRVVVVADLVVDRFISGVPKRISREAPVLILRHEGEHVVPGGGANAAANVAALGGRPMLCGRVGDDGSGRRLRAVLGARGIDTSGVWVDPNVHTPTKTRILAGARGSLKQQVVRFDIEDDDPPPVDAARLRDALLARTQGDEPAPVAVLSDYGYGGAHPGLVAPLRGVLGPSARLLVDSRYRLDAFTGVDGATPNQEEAEALVGRELPSVSDTDFAAATDPDGTAFEPPAASLDALGDALRRRLGLGFLLVTRGSRGMSLFDDGGARHLPVHGSAQVADVTGAGDTVIGTFALALAAGAPPLEAALLADYAGGIVVMKMGTATVSADELAAAVESDPTPLEALTRPLARAGEGS